MHTVHPDQGPDLKVLEIEGFRAGEIGGAVGTSGWILDRFGLARLPHLAVGATRSCGAECHIWRDPGGQRSRTAASHIGSLRLARLAAVIGGPGGINSGRNRPELADLNYRLNLSLNRRPNHRRNGGSGLR